ncbi:MAG: hypothetical protein JWM05_3703 [Acidimicrobiales bacterium]|nr:hypothetical protein [Acidimicrobiales bacterium]
MPSRRRLAPLAVGLALAASGALGACGHPSDPTRSQVERALRTSGFTAREARCVTDRLFSVLEPGELRQIAKRGPSAVPTAKATTVSTEIARCGSAAPTASTTTVPVPPATTTPSSSSNPSSTRKAATTTSRSKASTTTAGGARSTTAAP